MFTAWGDESESQASVDPGVYMLAAALCESGTEDEVRRAMTRARLGHENKVHWHGREAEDRRRVAELVGDLPVEVVLVLRCASTSDPIERRRRKCLRAMLLELDDLGCSTLTLESRGRADDQKDIALIDYMRRSRLPAAKIHLAHAKGPAESMLWVPDVVCGAVTQDRVGDGTYRKMIESRLTVVEIDADS